MSNDIRIGRLVLIGAQAPEPLLDWRKQLEDADYIITDLKNPRPPRLGARTMKPSPGVDLSGHGKSLAAFLADLAESYHLACGDYEMRSDTEKPVRKLEDNWKDSDPDCPYDYGEDAGVGYPDWDEFWTETYARGPGNPGGNRTHTKRNTRRPAVEPLRLVYPAIEQWWKEATGRGFSPDFARPKKDDEEGEPFERNNPPARFLIFVMQYLDNRFDQANASSICETVKKQRKEQRKKLRQSE